MRSCHSKKKHRGEELRAKGRREKSSNSQSVQSFFPGWGAGLNLLPIVTGHPHAPGVILCDATGGNPRWWRWRSGRNLLATWTWRCAQGRQMTSQSPLLRRLGTCSQLGRSSPRPHMPPHCHYKLIEYSWCVLIPEQISSSNLGSQLLLRPKEKTAKPTSTEPLCRHGWPRPHGALIFLASKTLVLSLFSSYHFWATPFLFPSLVASTAFPCKSGCLQRPSPPLSSVFPSEII